MFVHIDIARSSGANSTLYKVLHRALPYEMISGKRHLTDYRTHHLSILLPLVILVLRRSTVYREMSRAVFAYGEDRCHITASVAVVGCGPDSDELLVEHVLVTLLDELVRAGDQAKRVDMVELRMTLAL